MERDSRSAEIKRREFDIFNTWTIGEDGISLPQESTGATLIVGGGDPSLDSWLKNELGPLAEQARHKGIDVTDKVELVCYLAEQGHSEEAEYLRKNVSNAQCKTLLRS